MSETSKISFEFVCGYDGESTWKIVRYGHADHGREIRIKWTAYPLYQFGRRRYNYTIGEYMRQVVSNLRYMRFGCSCADMPSMAYVDAFNRMQHENRARSIAKFPDFDFTPLELVRGIVWLECTAQGEYIWRKEKAGRP